MKLKEGSVLYVRIDYKIGEQVESEQDAMDCMEYLEKIAKERYLVAGLFGDMEKEEMNGAMMLFEASSLEEAKEITEKDPIIERGFYRYELSQWNVMLVSSK